MVNRLLARLLRRRERQPSRADLLRRRLGLRRGTIIVLSAEAEAYGAFSSPWDGSEDGSV